MKLAEVLIKEIDDINGWLHDLSIANGEVDYPICIKIHLNNGDVIELSNHYEECIEKNSDHADKIYEYNGLVFVEKNDEEGFHQIRIPIPNITFLESVTRK